MAGMHGGESVNTIVIGGGQAGLSVGYHLAQRGVPFVILDASQRIGESWRERWDSLRLFTPARHAGLDGMPFPAAPFSFPTKDQMADYLEQYARTFKLPVRSGRRVERLSRLGSRFVIVAGPERFEADNVVVAMGNFQQPRIPSFANDLRRGILQMHSSEYRNPSELQDGPALVVGSGNSGAEIALDLVKTRRTILAGRPSGYIPFRIDGVAARILLERLVLRVVFHRVLTIKTPIGRRVRPKMLRSAAPLIRTKPRDLVAAGVERTGRVVAVKDGLPVLEDGRSLEVANVVWCTGFHHGFSWIDLPIFDHDGQPRHEAGVVREEPGLYFVGLNFLYAFSSEMIHGVGRDAARVAGHVASRAVAPAATV